MSEWSSLDQALIMLREHEEWPNPTSYDGRRAASQLAAIARTLADVATNQRAELLVLRRLFSDKQFHTEHPTEQELLRRIFAEPMDGPVAIDEALCSEDEARAAGLDVAPTADELADMAELIVAASDGASTPEVDLARAVPLLVAALRRVGPM